MKPYWKILESLLDSQHTAQARRLIRLPEVLRRTGISRSSLYAYMQAGTFPRSIRLSEDGRSCGWIESEIDEWITTRITASRKADA